MSGKVHKDTKNGLPTFCPYFSATDTSAYTKVKCLLSFLVPLNGNEYAVRPSFYFPAESCKQDPNLYIPSVYVDSLLTNIPSGETIDKFIDSLYKV